MASSTKAPPPPPPKQWPSEVSKLYDPVRELGVGGFASVMLSRKKKPEPNDDKLVAMKICGSRDALTSEVGYAHREIEILQQISHPNIMRVIDYWEPSPKECKCAAVIALSYSRGPTVESLLRHDGALSLVFCRVVSAQLIDAVAFLHSHAVIHRDIKPDNVIVTGAVSKDAAIWENEETPDEPQWDELRKRWHLTLVDFGFARALSPEDAKNPSSELQRECVNASYHKLSLDRSGHSLNSSVKGKRDKNKNLDVSMSKRLKRSMSSLGNRSYAAPEITKGITKEPIFANPLVTESTTIDITNTLSENVSEYGIMVDAFSLGCTMRYMLTGVPPNKGVDQVIAAKNHPAVRISHWVQKKMKGKDVKPKRKIKYRYLEEAPPEAFKLVTNLMRFDWKLRTSVRTAKKYPWILEALPESTEINTKDISYLQFNA